MSTIDSAVLKQTVKDQVRGLLNRLPEDCTMEDVQYGLFVLERIRQGIEAVERGDVVSHAEAEQRMVKWLTK